MFLLILYGLTNHTNEKAVNFHLRESNPRDGIKRTVEQTTAMNYLIQPQGRRIVGLQATNYNLDPGNSPCECVEDK